MANEVNEETRLTTCEDYVGCFFHSGSDGYLLYNKVIQKIYENTYINDKPLPEYVKDNFDAYADSLNKKIFIGIMEEVGKWVLGNCNVAKGKTLKIGIVLILRHENLKCKGIGFSTNEYHAHLEGTYPPYKGYIHKVDPDPRSTDPHALYTSGTYNVSKSCILLLSLIHI